jgi:hypothetical protein
MRNEGEDVELHRKRKFRLARASLAVPVVEAAPALPVPPS